MWIVCDVEADGPCPGLYSMVCFGAAVVEKGSPRTFYGRTEPITSSFQQKALDVSGFSREEHLTFPSGDRTMMEFEGWLDSLNAENLVFVSDNNGFDWQFINYYFHRFRADNPFGFSSRRIGDLYGGYMRNARRGNEFKQFRKTKHTHHPVDDAVGNVEALLAMHDQGLKIPGIA